MKKVVLLLLVLLFCSRGNAQSSIELEDIVIVSSLRHSLFSSFTGQASVLTADDLEKLGVTQTIDAFRYIPGIVVKDYLGNGTAVSLDFAGFGESAWGNVLVLVDGKRQNPIDMSGVNWNTIPLQSIDRIEVLPSGQGAVLYGNNAVSGVVNIITKTPKKDFQGTVRSFFDFNDGYGLGLSLEGKNKQTSFLIDAQKTDQKGYRDNSASKKQDLLVKTKTKINDRVSIKADAGLHQFKYGMPGALFETHIQQYGRRYSRFPNDQAEGKAWDVSIGLESDFEEKGLMDVSVFYRQKNMDSFFVSNSLFRKDKSQIIGVMPQYKWTHSIVQRENRMTVGMDILQENFSSDAFASYKTDRGDIKRRLYAFYVQQELDVTDKLLWMNGYRHEQVKYSFDYIDLIGSNPPQDTHRDYKINAFNTGLVFECSDFAKVFLNMNRSFRFPATDEFFYTDSSWLQQLDPNIKPQIAQNYEIGTRLSYGKNLQGEVSVYRMKVKDELYLNYLYDSNGSRNQNYDRTMHDGIKSSVEWTPWDPITLLGQYSWQNSRFQKGIYDKNQIPLVPEHQALLKMSFRFLDHWSFSIEEAYQGSAFLLNDQANQQRKSKDYWLTHIGLHYTKNPIKVFFGIKNIFNHEYAEYVGWDRWSDKIFSYPSPKRTFYLSCEYQW